MNKSREEYDDDISIELANHTEITLNSALMIRRRLDKEKIKGFDKKNFKNKFPAPRKLDIGCGNLTESDWIRLDCDENTKPDLLMDVQNLLLEDECIDKARMNYVLGYTVDPLRALSEVWRVLVPDGKLYLLNGAPASDIQLMPGVKHCFPSQFWQDVEQNSQNYIPKDKVGKWLLLEEKYDWSPTATKLASKLKLERDLVISTFRNVASKQFIILQKKI